MDALLGRKIQLVVWLVVEGLVADKHVPHDAVDPIFARAVLVRDDLLALLALLLLPRLGIKAMKNCWSPVSPSITGDWPCLAVYFLYAA